MVFWLKVGQVNVPVLKLPALGIPKLGVTSTGEIDNTTLPLPVLVLTPVPPFVIGSGVPLKLIAKVPLEVIGEPLTLKNDGTLNATLVTVPPPVPPPDTVAQLTVVPLVVKYLPLLPVWEGASTLNMELASPDCSNFSICLTLDDIRFL